MLRYVSELRYPPDPKGLTWNNVVKVTKSMTDMREMDDMHEILNEHFGNWRPAGTLVSVNNLSAPGARVELGMVAIVPGEA